MIKVGVTGNIGSGKTTVCKVFKTMGIPVVYADDLAKELMLKRTYLRHFLIDQFGSDVYHSDGSLNRVAIGTQIFSNEVLKKDLESLVHPAVKEYLEIWFKAQISPYAIEEAALIYESGSDQFLNKVIFVNCPIEIRMTRVMDRDQSSQEEFIKRDSNQWPAEDKISKADFVIQNDGKQSLIRQIYHIHQQLLKEK